MMSVLFLLLIPGTTVKISNVQMVANVGILGVLLFATVQLGGPARSVPKILMIVRPILAPSTGNASIPEPPPTLVNAVKVGMAKTAIRMIKARNSPQPPQPY